MPKDTQENISWQFVVFIIALILFIIVYISVPSEKKDINKKTTYTEQLEYNTPSKNQLLAQQQEIKKQEEKRTFKQPLKDTSENINKTQVQTQSNSISLKNKEIKNIQVSDKEKYNLLLDSLKTYPSQSISSVQQIVNKILEFKGYPAGTILLTPDSLDESRTKTQGSYLVATFQFPSGEMKVNRQQIYEMDIRELVAIIAHELDHFEKFAIVCKSIGINEFQKLLEENGVTNFNKAFWEKASPYANTSNFDLKTYTDAIKRYLNQNKIELTSSYSDFYRMAENIRNPLEISAYSVSDYVYKYYNMPISEGSMKKITKKFNEVDWAIYNIVSANPTIKEERIPLFDYFFSKAIIKNKPELTGVYNNCINNQDGDLTEFWLNFEKSLSDFYIKGEMNKSNVKIVLSLLSSTLDEARAGISDKEIANALKYKVKTILSNIVYPNAIKNIRKTALAYLKFTKERNINNPKTELDFILTLICIENELYNNDHRIIDLYYIKLPEELTLLYGIDNNNKSKRLNFILQNEEYINRRNSAQNTNDSIFLSDLINKYRLNKRI